LADHPAGRRRPQDARRDGAARVEVRGTRYPPTGFPE
jgi:hypothetical protein